MTFLELYGVELDRVLSTTDRTVLFTTARRQRAINAGMLKFVSMTKCTRAWGTIAMTDDVYEYDLVLYFPDYIEMLGEPSIKVVSSGGVYTRWIEGDDLPRTDPQLADRESPGWREWNSATPQGWYTRVDNGVTWIGTKYAPDITSGDTWTFYVPFLKKPTALANDLDYPYTLSGNVMSNLSVYDEAIVYYAASLLEPLRKGYAQAANFGKQFAGVVAQFLQDQEQQQPSRVSVLRDYYRESGRRPRPQDWMR